VAHLLSMTSGFSCDDNDDDSPGNEDKMQQQTAEPDWYKYTLALPMVSDPGGEQALYCSAGINLLGAIVAKATGTWIPAFFDEQVARPMNFGRYYWNLQPDGSGYLAGGAHLLPRDLLKLAQLYLSGGRWNGKQIIDQAWIDESTRQHSHFEPGHGYGYAWHLRQLTVGDRNYREYEAEGNGGQLAMVIPELDLAVLITAGNYSNFSTWGKFQDLLVQYVIPAVIK
jgi:CubicO group peptidase (beta-lactamase class C family)